ncbi:MAG: imelysin family protein [Pseudomonadota bacterium]
MTLFRCLIFLLLSGMASTGMTSQSALADKFLGETQRTLFVFHSHSALQALGQIQNHIEAISGDASQNHLDSARAAFAELVRHWKAVEAIYVAGILDENLIDHPRFIDHFHQGHVSIEETLNPILRSNKKLATAMFKSSSKSINALEYLLFENMDQNSRRWEAILVSIAFIRTWLDEIDQFYLNDGSFVQGGEKSLALLVNALVDSSYRLLNWRIGEPAGLVKKYRGKPAYERLEYYRSGFSGLAIQSILKTHARVFSIGVESGYLSTEGRNQGLEEITFVRGLIESALEAAAQLPVNQTTDVTSSEFNQVFQRVEALHKAYYLLLIDAMGFEGKIVDADGD